MIIKATVEL